MHRLPLSWMAPWVTAVLVAFTVAPACKLKRGGKGPGGAGGGASGDDGERSCAALCRRHAQCWSDFRRLGADREILGHAARAAQSCEARCTRETESALTREPAKRMVQECTPKQGCDAFFGCRLRAFLRDLQANPWKKVLVAAQQRLRALGRQGRIEPGALAYCSPGAEARRRLRALKRPEARAIEKDIDRTCRRAVGRYLDALGRRLAAAAQTASGEEISTDCARVGRWASGEAVGGWAQGKRMRARLAALTKQCGKVEEGKRVSLAVRDALRDAKLVKDALDAGRVPSSLYYKCIYKGRIYSQLVEASHPQAQEAAKALQRECFERLPAKFLAENLAQKSPSAAVCLKLRKLAALLRRHAGKDFLAGQKSSLKQLDGICPPP